MDIQGLKDKILQLAIQGKLVEQDKNDEPASALVQRIKEERDKLVREKKIKKPKKLLPIEEEEKPFEIPGSWEWVRLGEVGNIINGNSINAKIKEEKYSNIENGYSYIATKDIDLKTSKIDYENGVRIPFEDEEIFKIAPKNSILICSEGGSAGKKIGFTKKDVAFVNKLFNFNGYVNNINKYVYYLWKSPFFNERFEEIKTGIIGGVSMNNFKNISVPLPPLAEQKRIVEKVDQLFALIDELDSNKEELLEVINLTRNQVLQEAIRGKLVEQNPEDEPASALVQRIKEERDKLVREGKIRKPKKLPPIEEEEKPFEIPGSWEWVRLGDITRICLGLTHRPEYVENGIPFLSVKDISSGIISFSNCRFIEADKYKSLPDGSKPQKGDVLFGRVGTLGKPSIVEVDFPFGIFVSLGFLRPYIINMNIYLKVFMESKLFFDQIYANVFGSAQINLNTGWLSNFLIPLPPLSEQKRIVEKVDMIMDMLDELEKELIINI